MVRDEAELFHLHGLQEDFDADMTNDDGSAEPDGVARTNSLRLRWVRGRQRRRVRKKLMWEVAIGLTNDCATKLRR